MDDLVQRSFDVTRCSWSDLWPDCREMMRKHQRELERADWPLQPDHRQICQLEEAGGLICVGAREHASSALVGYGIWYLMPSLESEGVLLAQQGPWYVEPSVRRYGLGVEILYSVLDELRRLEVKEVYFHHSPLTPALGRFFGSIGAKPAEVVYSMKL